MSPHIRKGIWWLKNVLPEIINFLSLSGRFNQISNANNETSWHFDATSHERVFFPISGNAHTRRPLLMVENPYRLCRLFWHKVESYGQIYIIFNLTCSQFMQIKARKSVRIFDHRKRSSRMSVPANRGWPKCRIIWPKSLPAMKEFFNKNPVIAGKDFWSLHAVFS